VTGEEIADYCFLSNWRHVIRAEQDGECYFRWVDVITDRFGYYLGIAIRSVLR